MTKTKKGNDCRKKGKILRERRGGFSKQVTKSQEKKQEIKRYLYFSRFNLYFYTISEEEFNIFPLFKSFFYVASLGLH